MSCKHDDVIKWKDFRRYWPFVWGIHLSPHKGQWRGALMFFFYLHLNQQMSKQWRHRWFEMPSRSLWVIIMKNLTTWKDIVIVVIAATIGMVDTWDASTNLRRHDGCRYPGVKKATGHRQPPYWLEMEHNIFPWQANYTTHQTDRVMVIKQTLLREVGEVDNPLLSLLLTDSSSHDDNVLWRQPHNMSHHTALVASS